ncbi:MULTISPECIES: lysophospholipid acyltransferase family protein [unclassified Aureimonas]|uniref:lysophospholipid acyltransferase family protein n=1 Tax=unclassified Aureimonas TaxID=2615206 RepID=UPI0009EC7107|nr:MULTISPECIES: lysophospholipid acyltransferase family protein [unclassified Aureimonas]
MDAPRVQPAEVEAGKPDVPETPRPIFRALARRWKQLGRKLTRDRRATAAIGGVIYGALRAIHGTQRQAEGSSDFETVLAREHPAIVALWHGQHLLAPFFRPKSLPYVALLSKNADAAINAAVVERFGIGTVRGSGGRVRGAVAQKGGARALIVLRRMLHDGVGVCMIADVPKGVPRQAGLGIVTLARISGRPIIPSAAVTSRRRIVMSSWDKTSLPLPFGRIAVVLGEPIHVPADADDALLEEKRVAVTLAIEAANHRAIELAGARP